MRSLLTTLLIVLHFVAFAQDILNVVGQVSDAKNGTPLAFCTVAIKDKALGTIANENGAFEFKVPTSLLGDTLVVSHVGYKNYELVIDQSLPGNLLIALEEVVLELDEIVVKTASVDPNDIFLKAITRIKQKDGYPNKEFRLDGFYRELNSSKGENVSVVETALEIYGSSLTKTINEIIIAQFRKAYDRSKKDVLTDWTAGRNHLHLLLNGGINVIPAAKGYKGTIWGKRDFTIEKVTYYNDRLVYILLDQPFENELRMIVDAENFLIYKSELTILGDENEPKSYHWQDVKANGEKCGTILDKQGYEYREINGTIYPYYYYRKQDFRCFNLSLNEVTKEYYLSKELLINDVKTEDFPIKSTDKLRYRKGFLKYNEPYDTTFWKNFNSIKEVSRESDLMDERENIVWDVSQAKSNQKSIKNNFIYKTGDHAKLKFTKADTLFGTLTPDLAAYDVHHYALDIEVKPAVEEVVGTSKISFSVVHETPGIRIDLQEHFHISKIVKDDQLLPFSRNLDAVYIDFPDTLRNGELHDITVYYGGRPTEFDVIALKGAFHWAQDENNTSFAQSICQGYGPKGWFPVKNHLSDEPDSVSIRVTVPKPIYAVSNGTLVNVEESANKQTFLWKVMNPINNYGIAVHLGDYASRDYDFKSVSGDSFLVTYHYLKHDEEFALKRLEFVPTLLKVFEKYLGPYPFPEDGFKVVQSMYPMEHQSCVAGGQQLDPEEIIHETAHEWWGNSISIADNADIWIHETFATYMEALYVEETLGYQVAQEYINVKKNSVYNDHPLIGVKGVNHIHHRIEDKYFKGALIMNTLRHVVNNDQQWFQLLKDLNVDFRHAIVDSKRITDYVGHKLGMDLSLFFDQYLATTYIPTLILQQEGEKLRFKWDNTVDGFNMPIRINGTELTPTSAFKSTNLVISNDNIEELESKYLIKIVLKAPSNK